MRPQPVVQAFAAGNLRDHHFSAVQDMMLGARRTG